MYLAWKHIGLPNPTPVQYDIADFMQHGGDRLVTEAFRGVGKSYIASAYCVWAAGPHYFDPGDLGFKDSSR